MSKNLHPLLAMPLRPLNWLYDVVSQRQREQYMRGTKKRERLPGKTISIGNLEAGGTGKSPIVIALAQHLQSMGQRPAILTRGYRSGLRKDECMAIQGEELLISPLEAPHPDEALMQAAILRTVPVIIGANRVAAADTYLKKFPAPTHWILDDGFQHLKILRDLDIVLLDAVHPWSNNKTIPLGHLREYPQSLSRADVVLFTRADETHPAQDDRARVERMKIPFHCVPFEQLPLEKIDGESATSKDMRNVLVVTAIAKPDRLQTSLEGIGSVDWFVKRDHSRFSAGEVRDRAREKNAIITTEKDYWRHKNVFSSQQKPVFLLKIRPKLTSEDWQKILAKII